MKIGVFGGSFNPPTNAHILIPLELIQQGIVDKVIYVPNILNPCHNKNLVSKQDRYKMIKLMIEDYSKLEISDVDIKKDKQNYAYQTLDELKQIYPNDELYFIIRSDNLREIELWGKYEYLISTYKLIVIQRNKDNLTEIINSKQFLQKKRNNFVLLEKDIKISSTLIRNNILNSKDIVSLLPQKVYNYIKEKGLYGI